jgi:hypothetical protein
MATKKHQWPVESAGCGQGRALQGAVGNPSSVGPIPESGIDQSFQQLVSGENMQDSIAIPNVGTAHSVRFFRA